MVRYTRQAMQAGMANPPIETQIGASLDGVRQRVQDALSAFGEAQKQNQMEAARRETKKGYRSSALR